MLLKWSNFVLGLGFCSWTKPCSKKNFNIQHKIEIQAYFPTLMIVVALLKGAPHTWIQGAYVLQCTYFYEWSKSQESRDIMSWSITIIYLFIYLFIFFGGVGICLICCWHGMNNQSNIFFSFLLFHCMDLMWVCHVLLLAPLNLQITRHYQTLERCSMLSW
jgi:hypothetical protein